MQIQQLNNNEKMADPPTNTNNNKPSKLSQKVVEVKSFYNKHFPTDRKTYNWRLPFVGLVLSVLTAHLVTTEFAVKWYFNNSKNYIVVYCYIFIAVVLAYELYYGLKIGDRKQYTPWILLKVIELCFIFATIIYSSVENSHDIEDYIAGIIYGIIILVLNGLVTYFVASTSVKQFRGYASKTTDDENIYDNYDDV